MPSISVVLPFYCIENPPIEAIKSVLNQEFTDFELILVNNNSSEKVLKEVEKITKQNSCIILLHENRQGVVFASNTGMQFAQSK